MQYRLIFAAIFLLFSTTIFAQYENDNRTLFTVADTPVSVSEFAYIYSKTNGKDADFSKKSIEEYLDLYINFKLKVQKARDMQLDTIPALNAELAGYRKQLANSYLIDKSVTEKLIKEAYDHIQQDVDISHLLVSIKPNPSPADTLAAYEKIMNAKKRIEDGYDFKKLAEGISADPSAKSNGGHIGFVTALFPKGLYNLEKVAYTAPIGKLVGPIRTNAGYHLLICHARRPARGEMEAAHILIRNVKDKPEAAKKEIDEIYAKLEAGTSFETLATRFSQDKRTATNKGYIGFFGINRYEPSFEQAAFDIPTDGAYSKPIKTSVGWHIIKRISKKDIQPYNIEKSRLNAKIKKDTRFEMAKSAMLDRIKRENHFEEYPQVLSDFKASLDKTFLTYKWKASAEKPTKTLFRIGNKVQYSLADFEQFLERASRKRMRSADKNLAVDKLYEEYVNGELLKYEEKHLSEKYPEFRALMREYEEGILLFEATKQIVWDYASKDTVGLQQFFDSKLQGKYLWDERAVTEVYTIPEPFKKEAIDIRDYARTHTMQEVLDHFNKDKEVKVTAKSETFERFRNSDLKSLKWMTGLITDVIASKDFKTYKFYKIKEVIPAGPKKLSEARGYIVADYQEELEKKWVASLKDTYKVKIKKSVVRSLIKKK